jgi:hypothetical protein
MGAVSCWFVMWPECYFVGECQCLGGTYYSHLQGAVIFAVSILSSHLCLGLKRGICLFTLSDQSFACVLQLSLTCYFILVKVCLPTPWRCVVGEDVYICFVTSSPGGGKWSASHIVHDTAGGVPRRALSKRPWGGPQNRSGSFGEKSLALTGIRTQNHVARSLVSVPTALSLLKTSLRGVL